MSLYVGFDTSNYTTSVAVFDGENGENLGRLLDVPEGGLGLRQSDALFLHVKRMPELCERLFEKYGGQSIAAVAASTRPRAVEGSYMPCFLAGEGHGRALAAALGVPFFAVSHQQGHFAAAAWSAGAMELLNGEFLAWHLSGGTTELLYVNHLDATRIGGTSDLAAGQLVDRVGVGLGMPFPAGRRLDALAQTSDCEKLFKIKLNGLEFSVSGLENKVKDFAASPADSARYALNSLCDVVRRCTSAALEKYDLPVLCSGGVACNSFLRKMMTEAFSAHIAEPKYSADNAMGVAVLCAEMMK